jgi:hypothetical protein
MARLTKFHRQHTQNGRVLQCGCGHVRVMKFPILVLKWDSQWSTHPFRGCVHTRSSVNTRYQSLTAILNDRHVDQLVRVCRSQRPLEMRLCAYMHVNITHTHRHTHTHNNIYCFSNSSLFCFGLIESTSSSHFSVSKACENHQV